MNVFRSKMKRWHIRFLASLSRFSLQTEATHAICRLNQQVCRHWAGAAREAERKEHVTSPIKPLPRMLITWALFHGFEALAFRRVEPSYPISQFNSGFGSLIFAVTSLCVRYDPQSYPTLSMQLYSRTAEDNQTKPNSVKDRIASSSKRNEFRLQFVRLITPLQ